MSNYDLSLKHSGIILSIIENIVMVKTYNDILDYIKQSLRQPLSDTHAGCVNDFLKRISLFKQKARDTIASMEPDWLRCNFLRLLEDFG